MMLFHRLMFRKIHFLYLFILLLSMAFWGCGSSDAPLKNKDSSKPVTYFELPETGKASKELKEKLKREGDIWFRDYIANTPFAGGVIVTKDGEILFEKYAGTVAPNSARMVDEHTAMHIASVSKTFTAMAVLHLAEQGKLNIDSSFAHYFPGFSYNGVSVKTLLNHRSGLPNYPYFMETLWTDKTRMVLNKDVLDYLNTKKAILPEVPAADTKFSYCNTNYALLALLIEEVTGISYPAYMQDSIFTPLKMKDTHVFVPSDSSRVTLSYTWRGAEIPFNFLDAVYGDKNIYSTARDLVLWDRFLKSKLFLSDASLAAAYAPYSNERPGTKNYGLGWRLLLYPENKKIIFHNGWWHGNTAAFIRLFDEGVTIIALNNRHSRAAYKAKILANSFYPYFTIEPEDEDFQKESNMDSTATIDSLKKLSPKKRKS